jgi:serine/threonine protein phosphatase PrpC
MNQDSNEMAAFQSMLNESSQIAREEKEGEEKKYKSHLDEIKNKFAETVKAPLEGVSGPLLFEGARDIIVKGTKKALGSSFDADTTKAVTGLIEKGDVKGFTNHVIDKLASKHNVEDVLARDSAEVDSEGIGSTIRSRLSQILGDFKQNVQGKLRSIGKSLKDGAQNLKSKFTGEIPRLNMSSEINHISPYQDPFTTGLDGDIAEMASRGDLAGARATLAFRQIGKEEGGTAESFANKMRNARSLASDGITNNQSSFQIGDAIRAEQQRITSQTADVRASIQDGIDKAKSKVNQLDRTDENAPQEPIEPEKPSFNPSEEQKGLSNIEDIAGAHAEMEEGESRKIGGKIFKKVGENMLESDAETGGPEDIAGDVVTAVVGLGTLMAGLFAHKRNIPKPPPMPTLRAAVEFGV